MTAGLISLNIFLVFFVLLQWRLLKSVKQERDICEAAWNRWFYRALEYRRQATANKIEVK